VKSTETGWTASARTDTKRPAPPAAIAGEVPGAQPTEPRSFGRNLPQSGTHIWRNACFKHALKAVKTRLRFEKEKSGMMKNQPDFLKSGFIPHTLRKKAFPFLFRIRAFGQ
jgi:hypothetical protein